MDIHKPKPWHGAREFLKEYLTIVIGVLTALGAEAGVEWLHWQHLAEQHEEQLHASAEFVAVNAIQRLAVDRCVRAELQKVAEALRQPGAEWRGFNPGAAGAPGDWLPPKLTSPQRAWAYTAWDSAESDGTLVHLPREVVNTYSLLFATSKAIAAQQQIAASDLPELTPLAFDQPLTAQDKARYLVVIARTDRTLALMDSMSGGILTSAAQAGFWPPDDKVRPLMDITRRLGGDCVRGESRSDYLEGGPKAQPMMKLWRRGG